MIRYIVDVKSYKLYTIKNGGISIEMPLAHLSNNYPVFFCYASMLLTISLTMLLQHIPTLPQLRYVRTGKRSHLIFHEVPDMR